MTRWQRGYVQVYTGDGKGKTTAALGLALRAAGAGLRVLIAQFAKGKGMRYSELEALDRFETIEVRRYGRDCFIHGEPQEQDIEMARAGLAEVREEMHAGRWDVVVLDEANIATHFGLFSVEELLAVIEEKPEGVELIITGRRANPRVIEAADLVTEMREVKHYYAEGVRARTGIEC